MKKNSMKIAKLARDYHKKFQQKKPDTDKTLCQQKITQVLSCIKAKTLRPQKDLLEAQITRTEVLKALINSDNNSAARPRQDNL